ncbi:MAG: ATP-binding protein [Planctomycetota bacterium]|nr:ATP-binding protein [Planctomycetota bacterium]
MSTIVAPYVHEILELLDRVAQILVTDREERILAVNRTFCETYGYEAGEVLGKTPRMIASGAHPRRFWDEMRQTVADGRPWRGQVCNRTRSGGLVWVDMLISGLPQGAGYIAIAYDITERVRQQGRLAIKERLLRGASQLTQLGGWGIVLNHDAVHWTLGAQRLLGLPTPGSYLSWQRFLQLLREHIGDEVAEALENLSAAGGSWRWEGLRRDGRLWLELHAEVSRDPLGQLQIEGAVQDITERKHAELAAREAQQRAEQAVALRDRFLAVLSHEMRNPLQGLLGGLQLALDARDAARKDDYLRVALQGGRLLLRLLDDILTVAKLEAGHFQISPLPTDFQQIVSSLEQLYGLRARQLSLSLTFDIDPRLPPRLCLDELRMTQILGNLIANGLKFTARGGVCVQVRWLEEDAQRGTLAITVSDTGIGIPPDLRHRLFAPFVQVDPRAAGAHGGTGLGLWICASLLKLMQGSITVDDNPGGGTRFHIRLPVEVSCALAPAQPSPRSEAPTPAFSGHVLLVEDDPVNRIALASMLTALGLRCTTVGSAEEALGLWQQRGGEITAVISDLGLPGMDGRTLVRHLRGSSATPVPCFAITGEDPREALSSLLADGFISVLVKPIGLDSLRATLQPFLLAQPMSQPR